MAPSRNSTSELRTDAKRVLLVDDHAPLAEATAAFLRDSDMEVRIAASGQDALNAAAEFKPDIVLCDMYLPDTLGPDVAKALREIPNTKRALIVIHTATSENDLTECARSPSASSIDLFLSKPLTEEKLETLILELRALKSTRRRSK